MAKNKKNREKMRDFGNFKAASDKKAVWISIFREDV